MAIKIICFRVGEQEPYEVLSTDHPLTVGEEIAIDGLRFKVANAVQRFKRIRDRMPGIKYTHTYEYQSVELERLVDEE